MPHITTSLNLLDGLATPVARSFVPQKLGMDNSRFAYKVLPARMSWVLLDVIWSDSTDKRPTVRQDLKVEFPIVRQVNGVDTRAAVGRATVTFVIPDEMTEAEVKDMRKFLMSALDQSALQAGIFTREPIWG